MTDEPVETIVEDTPPEATPSAQLVYKQNGAETDTAFALAAGHVVGRFDAAIGPVDVDLASLDEGTTVSRRHARVDFADDQWSVTDLGSSNGTFILRETDFERVETADLADGTELAFGNARFVFRLS